MLSTSLTNPSVTGFSPGYVSGLVLWLSADHGVYQDSAGTTPVSADGDRVGLWLDKSPSANNVLQASNSLRATYKTNIQNSLPAIRFNGVDQFLRSVAGGPDNFTCFLTIIRRGGSSTDMKIICWGDDSVRAKRSVYHRTNNRIGVDLSVTTLNSSSGDFVTDETNQWSVTYAGGSSLGANFFKDATSIGFSSIGTVSNSFTNEAITLGANNTAGELWNGDVCSLIVYDSVLSTTDRLRVQAYEKSKWATP